MLKQLCTTENSLYVTFNDELSARWEIGEEEIENYVYEIKGFSGVHTQVKFFNLGMINRHLMENNLLEQTCQSIK